VRSISNRSRRPSWNRRSGCRSYALHPTSFHSRRPPRNPTQQVSARVISAFPYGYGPSTPPPSVTFSPRFARLASDGKSDFRVASGSFQNGTGFGPLPIGPSILFHFQPGLPPKADPSEQHSTFPGPRPRAIPHSTSALGLSGDPRSLCARDATWLCDVLSASAREGRAASGICFAS
jgi:hypothetical protein